MAAAQYISQHFGQTSDTNEPVQLFTLKNGRSEVEILNLGGYVRKWTIHKDESVDVLLGYDTLSEYEKDAAYINCLVGRVCNRIARGRFSLNGKEHQLAVNNGPNHLHGGIAAFHKKIWTYSNGTTNAITLKYQSSNGEEGYPGSVNTTVKYQLTADDALVIKFEATVNEVASPVNLTSHMYFNLAGHESGSLADQSIQINACRYLPVDDTGLVIGEEPSVVDGTEHDLRNMKNFTNDLILDNYFVLNESTNGKALKPAVRLNCTTTGLQMDSWTDAPGVQVYTSNFMDTVGKGGAYYGKKSAVAVETHGYPDAVNRPKFPSVVVQPGETYRQTAVYKISDSGSLEPNYYPV